MSKQRYNQKIVTIREKKISKGRISLYLDMYSNGKRSYDFLKIYLYEKPNSPEQRTHNKDMLQLAEQVRASKETEIKHSDFGVLSPAKRRSNFLVYYENYITKYTKKDTRMLSASFNNFKKFLLKEYQKKSIVANEITDTLITKYRDYLLKEFKGQTPNSYFSRFKKVIKHAYKEGYFVRNPAEDISCPNQENITKAIVDFEEISAMVKAPCGNPEVKRAFLFCLNTGLRFVDIKQLTWNAIDKDLLRIGQQKTRKEVVVYLNSSSIKLLGDRGKQDENIFSLPSLDSCLRTVKTWTKKAGITKNVTWHSARHSFAVNLLTQKTDIKTVSSLLGHSGLRHTEKYTHVVDELKKQAVNTLPEIDV